MAVDDDNKPTIAFFLNTETDEVIMDFHGTVHASKKLIPITPEQADDHERDALWGEGGSDLLDTDDPNVVWDFVKKYRARKNN